MCGPCRSVRRLGLIKEEEKTNHHIFVCGNRLISIGVIASPDHTSALLCAAIMVMGQKSRVMIFSDRESFPNSGGLSLEGIVKPLVFNHEETFNLKKGVERLFPINPKFGPPPKVLGRADLAKISRNHIRK